MGKGREGRGEEKQMGWRESSDSAAGVGLWGLLSRLAPQPVLLGEQQPAGAAGTGGSAVANTGSRRGGCAAP